MNALLSPFTGLVLQFNSCSNTVGLGPWETRVRWVDAGEKNIFRKSFLHLESHLSPPKRSLANVVLT